MCSRYVEEEEGVIVGIPILYSLYPQSDSCKITIPELSFEVTSGTLGSRFTTLEALLVQIRDQIQANPFLAGDTRTSHAEFDAFIARLNDVIECKELVTVVMEDPLGLSYLQNVYAPDKDPNMEVEEYERGWEENEEWGLNDMKTENYGEGESEEGDKKEEKKE